MWEIESESLASTEDQVVENSLVEFAGSHKRVSVCVSQSGAVLPKGLLNTSCEKDQRKSEHIKIYNPEDHNKEVESMLGASCPNFEFRSSSEGMWTFKPNSMVLKGISISETVENIIMNCAAFKWLRANGWGTCVSVFSENDSLKVITEKYCLNNISWLWLRPSLLNW